MGANLWQIFRWESENAQDGYSRFHTYIPCCGALFVLFHPLTPLRTRPTYSPLTQPPDRRGNASDNEPEFPRQEIFYRQENGLITAEKYFPIAQVAEKPTTVPTSNPSTALTIGLAFLPIAQKGSVTSDKAQDSHLTPNPFIHRTASRFL